MAKYISPSDIIADKEFEIFGVKVKEYLLANHNINSISLPSKRVKPLKGITIHNTNDLANIEDAPHRVSIISTVRVSTAFLSNQAST